MHVKIAENASEGVVEVEVVEKVFHALVGVVLRTVNIVKVVTAAEVIEIYGRSIR